MLTPISSSIKKINTRSYDYPFYLVLIFLFFEYGRPQNFFPFLGDLRPGWIIQPLLFLLLLIRGSLIKFLDIQTECFLGLIFLMMVNIPIATNNYWAFHIWKSIALYFIIYLSILNFVDSFHKIEKYIDTWIVINLVCAIVGIKHGGKIPSSAFMGDENDFALVMNMVTPLAYFMFLAAESSKKKIFYLFACCLFISANVTSFSRGGFIGLLAVIIYCWYKTPKKLLSTIIIALLVGTLYFSAPPTYWDEVKSIKDENIETGTGEERWYSWKIGWKMFLDYPVIGVGQGNYPFYVANYEPPDALGGRSRAGRAAHSIYFTLISELGFVGFILFSVIIFNTYKNLNMINKLEKKLKESIIEGKIEEIPNQVSFFRALHKLKFISFGIQGGFIGYLISGIFLSVLYYPHFWILLADSIAIKNVINKLVEKKRQ